MKLKRAYSPGEVLNMKIPRFEFSGDWQTSIGNPAKSGVWIIWGASGNGKSSFVMQLAKYLCSFGRVIYDSLEESTGLSFQMSLKRHKMGEVKKKLIILDREPMEQLEERLRRRGTACLVFSLWANGLDETGKILWVKEPEFEVDQKAIPRVITDVQENGTALQVDNQRKRYVKTEEFDEDKPNGYGRFKVFLLRRKLKKH